MPKKPHSTRRRLSSWLLLALLGALAWITWRAALPDAPSASRAVTAGAPPEAPPAQARAASAAARVAALRAREAQRARWQLRLERAEDALEAYRRSTRYPPTSQALAERPDQAFPNRPVAEERAFGDGGDDGPRLVTTQERVFVQGAESVGMTLSLRDASGRILPLRVLRASAREITAPDRGSLYPEVPLSFADDGSAGDATAGDGIFSLRFEPSAQGFGGLQGQIRVEAWLQHDAQQAPVAFDLVYTGDAPAQWQGGVREVLADGSLVFALKAAVREPGRYVVRARVDDANGQPLALLGFNDELPAGAQDVRLTLFGKLVRDAKPAFPLTVRDVDGFLLRPDAFPDRRLMPRLEGPVHVSQRYALDGFSDAEWTAEERTRYLDELGRDVADAKRQLQTLDGAR